MFNKASKCRLSPAEIEQKADFLPLPNRPQRKVWLLNGNWDILANQIKYKNAYNPRPIATNGLKRLGISPIKFSDGPRGVVMGHTDAPDPSSGAVCPARPGWMVSSAAHRYCKKVTGWLSPRPASARRPASPPPAPAATRRAGVRLSRASRRRKQRQRPLQASLQPLHQPRPRHQAGERRRKVQFGGQQGHAHLL